MKDFASIQRYADELVRNADSMAKLALDVVGRPGSVHGREMALLALGRALGLDSGPGGEAMNTTEERKNEMTRQYTRGDQAWYGEAVECTDAVQIGLYADDGSTSGEFSVRWIPNIGLKLCVFDDAWEVLVGRFGDLLLRLALDVPKTFDALCKIMDELGIEDATERKKPKR